MPTRTGYHLYTHIARLDSWGLELLGYDFDIVYRKGAVFREVIIHSYHDVSKAERFGVKKKFIK